ncbi:MAG: DUF5107 domain-containing protein [Rikenellaceae bacterium]
MKTIAKFMVASIAITTLGVSSLYAKSDKVNVSVKKIDFPTYDMGPDDPCLYFKDFRLEGLRYFRDQRTVYPYTFKNDYLPTKQDVTYDVVRLENDHIYVDIIPQLRGRVQGAVDKRNNWDFIYYNHAIKPAEISVRSAWLAGGLEYNHPGGHAYTQLEKISYEIKEYKDGSKAVIVSEIEPARRFKWQYEVILRPNDLALETKGRFISIVPYAIPFVSSNNAAMHGTDEMELIYPQDTYATGHGNSNLKKWDQFSHDGSDWNWIKNIKQSLSVFTDGVGLTQDYWGVYSHDEGIEAGSVVVGDHRQCPGKKYFSWGTSASGKQWDTFLSDEDGGYVEVQHQAFNSKMDYDYGVLDPFEVKEFSIYWYPIMGSEGFVKASREVVVNFKRQNDKQVKLDMEPTLNLPNSKIVISKNGEVVEQRDFNFVVGKSYNGIMLDIDSTEDDLLAIEIFDKNNRSILQYQTEIVSEKPVVNEIVSFRSGNIEELCEYSINELYTLAMSNYFNPYGVDADEFVAEMLARDPYESRALRMKGTTLVTRSQYVEAIAALEKSLVDGFQEGSEQARFMLGYANLQIGNLDKAHEWLAQSSRHREFLDSSLYYLAVIEVLKGDLHEARMRLEEVPFSRLTHPSIYNLLTYVCRKLGDSAAAKKYLATSFERDPLNFQGYIEDLEVNGSTTSKIDKINFVFDRKSEIFLGSQLYLETAVFYMEINDFAQALKVINIAEEHFKGSSIYPFVLYYKGYCLMKSGDKSGAMKYYADASAANTTYVFPYRQSTLPILVDVVECYPNDAIAWMYLGDLLYYLRRHDEAIDCWGKSYELNPNIARVNRNLAISRHVKKYDSIDETIKMLEEAFAASNKSLRMFVELENLYILTKDNERLAKLYDNNLDIIYRKGAYALNAADFYNRVGRPADALKVMLNSYFSAEERLLGTPYRHVRYENGVIGSGKELLAAGKFNEAAQEFQKAYLYPESINEAKVNYPVTTPTDYYVAISYKKAGNQAKATEYFNKALDQKINDYSVASIYKAMSLREIGREDEAKQIIGAIVGKFSTGTISAADYYVLSLAYAFQGNEKMAAESMATAVEMDYNVAYTATYSSAYIQARKYSIE